MKKTLTFATLSVSALALCACGAKGPDAVLNKMHDRIVSQMLEKAGKNINAIPSIANADAVIALRTQPIADVFAGRIALDINEKARINGSNQQNIKFGFDLGTTIKVDAPSGTFGEATKAKTEEHLSLDLLFTVLGADRTLVLTIPKFALNTPPSMLPVPLSLPAVMMGKWYGATYDQINAELKKSAMNDDGTMAEAPVQTIEQIIGNIFQNGPARMQKFQALANKIHIWKGIAVLPEHDGLIDVQVESDAEKVKQSGDALKEFFSAGSVTPSNMMDQSDAFGSLDSALDKSEEGKIVGVLSADAKTYDFRGFKGTILDASGATLGSLDVTVAANGEMHAAYISATDVKDSASFDRAGSGFVLTSNNKRTLYGTFINNHFQMTAIDPETDTRVMSVNMLFSTLTDDDMVLDGGAIDLPTQSVHIIMTEWTYHRTNGGKDYTSTLKSTGTYKNKPAFDLSYTVGRKEAKSVTIDIPKTYAPFETLQTDLMGMMMGGGEGMMAQ